MIDVVAPQVFIDARPLFFEHVLLPIHEVVDRHALHLEIDRLGKSALPKTGEMQCRFAKGLGWNGAGVHACATENRFTFDERDAFAEIGSLRRSFFAGWTGSD